MSSLLLLLLMAPIRAVKDGVEPGLRRQVLDRLAPEGLSRTRGKDQPPPEM